MHPWKKKKSLVKQPRFVCAFDPMEREVLGNLAAAVTEALIHRAQSAPRDELAELTGMPSGHKEAPEDPSLRRLLPDFERDGDEEYEGDNSLLRSLHEQDITKAKISHLQVVGTHLGPDGSVNVSISEEEAHAWVQALNDMRLFLAAGEADYPDERDQLVEWLAVCQDSLLSAMME